MLSKGDGPCFCSHALVLSCSFADALAGLTYTDEGRPPTDPVLMTANLRLANIYMQAANEIDAAVTAGAPHAAKQRQRQDRCAVMARYYFQQLPAGGSVRARLDATMLNEVANGLAGLLADAATRHVGTGAFGETGVEHIAESPLATSWCTSRRHCCVERRPPPPTPPPPHTHT